MIASFSQEIIATRDARCKKPGFFPDPSLKKNSQSLISPIARADRAISARVFPNGEFGVGFIPHRGISAKDRKYESDRRYAEENAEIIADIEIDANLPEGFRYTRRVVPGHPPKLGIGSELSHTVKRYGLKGITCYGRKIVRNAGYMLGVLAANRYNRKLCMGTVTVPSYSPNSMENICKNWGKVQKRFFQELKRQYGRYGYAFDYVSVTEIQPKRLASRGEVGLHLHFLFTSIRLGRGKWVLPHSWVRATWGRILADYLVCGDIEQLPNYKADVVTSSASGYLSKYMSKGGDDIKTVLEEHGEQYLPKQWWSISSRLRKCISHHTIRSRGAEAEKVLVIARMGESEYVYYVRVTTLPTGANEYAKLHNCPEEVVLGYGGMLSPAGVKLFSPGNQIASIRKYLRYTLDKTGCN